MNLARIRARQKSLDSLRKELVEEHGEEYMRSVDSRINEIVLNSDFPKEDWRMCSYYNVPRIKNYGKIIIGLSYDQKN
jgi:hypothetical protein